MPLWAPGPGCGYWLRGRCRSLCRPGNRHTRPGQRNRDNPGRGDRPGEIPGWRWRYRLRRSAALHSPERGRSRRSRPGGWLFDLFAVEHDVSGNGDGNRIRPAPERPGKGNLGRQNLHKQEKEAGEAVSKIQTVAISHIQIYTFILSRWINSLILYDFGYIPL